MKGFEKDWKHLSGRMKERWAKLSDKDLAEIDGRDKLEKKLHILYGWDKQHVDAELDRFEKTLGQGKSIDRRSGKGRYFPDQR